METFGDKLRQAVESLGLPIDDVAAATGLSIEHIRALERNDFDALPDDEIVSKGLASFARLVGVDPDEVIEDYLLERQRWNSATPAELEVVEEIESPQQSGEWVVAEPSSPEPRHRGRTAILISVVIVLVVIGILYLSRTSTASVSRSAAVTRETAPPRATASVTREEHAPPVTPSQVPDPIRQVPMPERPAVASRLSIPEHGVGRGVVEHQLVGEAERFWQGERVWFWTLVQGGAAGESIDHVWLHENREVSRVPLRLGGARWRTRSYKDLNPGSRGRWAVEARDATGAVLARREFGCSARP